VENNIKIDPTYKEGDEIIVYGLWRPYEVTAASMKSGELTDNVNKYKLLRKRCFFTAVGLFWTEFSACCNPRLVFILFHLCSLHGQILVMFSLYLAKYLLP